ncbi:arginase family protein [Actinoplanes sp. DH11]|uniref:arginase family protein n=1 Tax=Actinoplanes sp. DH11 TaxID=2857011 RepID=UPI001E590121|nr:arginase family protein [Actinoplanes sp. DH11]
MTILVPFHQDTPVDLPAAGTAVSPVLDAPGHWDRMAAVWEATAAAVAAAGPRPLVLSGDCLIAGAVVAGVQRTGVDPALVWFDAHGDLHTLETSTSGYLGGLSLRLALGAHPERYADRIGLRPVDPARAVLVDGRDLDPAEAAYLAGGAVRQIPVGEAGPGTVPEGPLVVHVDVDVVDGAEIPGLLFPVPGGPSADAVLAACARLAATGRVVAFDVALPWHPATGEREQATRAALVTRLVAELGA